MIYVVKRLGRIEFKKTCFNHRKYDIIRARDPKQCGGAKGYETIGGDDDCDDDGDDDEDTHMRAHRRRHMRANESRHIRAHMAAHM